MKIINIYYKITENYWVELDQYTADYLGSIKVDSYQNFKTSGQYFNASKIEFLLKNSFKNDEKYFVISDDDIFVIYKIRFFERILLKYLIDKWTLDYNVIKERFKRKNKEKLNDIFDESTEIKETLEKLKNYVFCDHYSFWLYNSHTKYFTLYESSFKHNKSFKIIDTNSVCYKKLDGINYYPEEFSSEKNSNIELEEIKYVNRIAIELSVDEFPSSMKGIFVLFSKKSDYILRTETVKLFQNIITLKLSKSLHTYIGRTNHILHQLSLDYKFGEFDKYLQGCTKNITHILGWEASSIFLTDNKKEYLELKAYSNNSNDVKQNIKYNIEKDRKSMTVKSILERLTFSYDIENEIDNTHIFDERCKSKPKNWLGIALWHSNNQTIGVLRVKNKIDNNGNTQHFNEIDITVLNNIASIISYQYELESNYVKDQKEKEKELKKKTDENYNLNTFIKTFRHEIKSPLIVVTQASSLIKQTLYDEKLIDTSSSIPKSLNNIFEDLSMVGDRLGYVASSLTFNASELVRDIKKCHIFQDIVAPIKAFSIRYALNRNKYLKINIDSLLKTTPVICDPIAASIVFHILIDNAIKYANEDSIINVYGKELKGKSIIIVENFGIAIYPDEISSIFDQFVRGREAELEEIEGSGIGLYLAKQIMDKLEGEIVLSNLNNPVRFEIHLKNLNS